ncbi:tetratricopeptide repeat-containing sensor histidine kinase [Flavobacterium sp.]
MKIYKMILVFASCLSFSQTRQSIDSINTIPFGKKLEQAATLDFIYLKNVQNAIKINYKLGQGQSYSNLALINYYQGKFEKDLEYSLKAILIYGRINAKDQLALEYGELGFRMKKRRLKKALYYMRKAKFIAEENNFQKPLLSIYNNYGVLKEMQNQNDSALFFYRKGLLLKLKINDSVGVPYSINNIAGILVKQRNYNEAKANYEEALKIRIALKDEIGIAENYTYLGDLFSSQKKYSAAIDYYKLSLEKAKKYHYLDLVQNNYKMLSQNYEALNDKDAALHNFKQYTVYKDSLLNKETNSKVAELEVRFDTNEKEKLLLEKENEVKNSRSILVMLSLLTLFIGLIGFLIYRQQKLKNKQQQQEFKLQSAIKEIESQNSLQEQRLSISRDLHDNIGAQLTFVISSVDNLKLSKNSTDVTIDNQLNLISEFTKTTILELRDTIWAMNTDTFSFEDLRSRMFNFTKKAQSSTADLDISFSINESLLNYKISSLAGITIYRIIQESINNAIKHASASTVKIDIDEVENNVKVEIIDDGEGFIVDEIEYGNGILNMQKRVEDVQGEISIYSILKSGTKIIFTIPKNKLA